MSFQVTNMSVVPCVNKTGVSWKMPECFPDYELQVVNFEYCENSSLESCVAEFSADVAGTTELGTEYQDFGPSGVVRCPWLQEHMIIHLK